MHQEGYVSLADYRGRAPVLVSILRGLWCPFCRRHIASFGPTRQQLLALGVESLGIVASSLERARMYLRFHPAPLPLAADPELRSHRAFGLPHAPLTPDVHAKLNAAKINPTGDLAVPLGVLDATFELNRRDRYDMTGLDAADVQRTGSQNVGQFLVDRDGIVRWANIECAHEGPTGTGKFPSTAEIVAAARSLCTTP